MLTIRDVIVGGQPETSLSLPFAARSRSRQRVVLDDGREAGLFLPRGTVLRGGTTLRAEEGAIVEVRAAPEEVSSVHTHDGLLLARACYHLGNRHVPLAIGPGWARYLRDPVLDDMVRGFGLTVEHISVSFEPEAGAYHSHDHEHA